MKLSKVSDAIKMKAGPNQKFYLHVNLQSLIIRIRLSSYLLAMSLQSFSERSYCFFIRRPATVFDQKWSCKINNPGKTIHPPTKSPNAVRPVAIITSCPRQLQNRNKIGCYKIYLMSYALIVSKLILSRC